MIDRRDSLKLILAGLAQASFSGTIGCATSAPRPSIAPHSLPVAGKKGILYYCLRGVNGASTLRLEDWETGARRDFSIPLEIPHSITQDRFDPSILYAFEVFGSCAKVDLKTGTSILVDHRKQTDMFNGHGVHTLSGKELICTEIMPQLKVVTTVRDAHTLQRISIAPEACHFTHHVTSLPGTTRVACGILHKPDGGRGGGITFYDYAKNEVVKHIETPEPIIHVFAISDEEVIGISRPVKLAPTNVPIVSSSMTSEENSKQFMSNSELESGPIYYASIRGHKRAFWDVKKKDLFKGGFGIAMLAGHKSFLSSFEGSDSILFWKDGQVGNVLRVPHPQSMTFDTDKTEFAVLTDGVANHYKTSNFELMKTTKFELPIVLMGSFQTSYA